MSSNGVLRSSIFAMSFISSDDKVREEARNAVLKKGEPRELPFVTPAGTKLSAVEFSPRRHKKLRDAISDMNEYVAEAAASGSPFVAFPELTGLAFLGVLPRSVKIIDALREELSEHPIKKTLGYELALQTQGCIGEIFFNAFSEIARGNRMLIAAGGFYVTEGKTVKNRQYLFSETGEVLIYQDKLILSPLENELGITSGDEITYADTRIGRMALLTASCAPHYEPFAAAAALGCRMVVAGASPFGEDISLLRCRAQEQGLCAVSPGLKGGEDFGLSLDTAPVIYAPRATLRTRDGIAPAGKGKLGITARVDLSGTTTIDHYSSDRNGAFFAKMLK